ncbi:MAG TPA: YCF48-related protein [Ignavibacteriaceae bacterium]|nr:YCF48-related protein [Ignavibacteriaceae bacterium]
MKKVIKLFFLVVVLNTNHFSQSSHNYCDIFFLNTQSGWILSNNSYLWKTTNAGTTWISIYDSRIDTSGKIIFDDEQNGWLLLNSTLYSSNDGGSSWQYKYEFSPIFDDYNISFINDSTGFVSNTNKLYKTTDEGISWYLLTDTLGVINKISRYGENLLFISSNYGPLCHVYKSTDKGKSWIQSFDWGSLDGDNFGKVEMFNETEGVLELFYADFIGQSILFKTTDAGQSWDELGYGIAFDFGIADFEFTSDQTGWVTTQISSILRTTDGGFIWDTLQTHLANINNFDFFNSDVAYGISNNHIYYTNDGWITYSIVDSIITNIDNQKIVPGEFVLYQNYPNPFNSTSVIKYSLPKSSNIIIKVFDVLGKEIETLVNEEKPAGTYEFIWKAFNLPSGIYFYRLQAGSSVETKKMILLR